MKTLTIDIPDTLDISQERQFIAENWYRAGKITVVQAAHIAGLTVVNFLSLAEPQTKTDRLLQKMARTASESFNLDEIKRQKQDKGLNWNNLDKLPEEIAPDEPIEDLIVQIGK